MAPRLPPIARIRLARSTGKLLALPAVLVVVGIVAAVAALLVLTTAVALAVVAVGVVLALVGIVLAWWPMSVRLDVEEAAIRVRSMGGERVYPLVAGPVTRVRFIGENASPLREHERRLGGWQLGAATLRDEEEIHVVRLAPTATAILVPTEKGRLAIAPADEAELLDALTRAARARQETDARAAAAAQAEREPEPEPEVDPMEPDPAPLTGIERALLEQRLAEERAAALAAAFAELAEPQAEGAPATETLEPAPVVAASTPRFRLRRPTLGQWRRGAAFVVLPLIAAGVAWGIGIVTGRMPPPGTDIGRLTTLALVMAGPATSVGAIMALAWWPRLVGVVVAGGLAASVLVGRVLLG